jgi:hypothetical protein
MNSASLCSLAGRYENPIPPRCLAPIDFLKIPALDFSAIPAVSSRLTITTFILLDFKDAKWAVSPLTHCLNPFQENMCISRFMIQILPNIQTVQEREKTSEKETSNF